LPNLAGDGGFIVQDIATAEMNFMRPQVTAQAGAVENGE
jgi:hypothetical protein